MYIIAVAAGSDYFMSRYVCTCQKQFYERAWIWKNKSKYEKKKTGERGRSQILPDIK